MPSSNGPARLREILAGDQCMVACSLFDPMSARIADELGFELGIMGGSVAALAVLGAPDLILLSLTELAEQARRVCRAGRVGLIVDADLGYGNALSVLRTVEELQAAGVAGISIEDTLLPRAFGAGDRAQLTSLEEGVGKMLAAVAARATGAARGLGPMGIFGRTSAATVTGIDDAIARFAAYEAAGVDALFLPGLDSREQLDRIAAATRLPLILAGCSEKLADLAYLRERRVKVWMAGHQAFNAAVQGLVDAMKAVREGARPSELKNIAPGPLMARLTRAADYQAATRDYLGG
jgi:carboxyvinyl-carboxyphosphonate phosphorylmutase